MKPEQILEQINELLNELNELAPNTQNNVVKQLTELQTQLQDPTAGVIDENAVNDTLTRGQKLLHNLRLAQEAAQYTAEKIKSTNYDFYDLKNNTELERHRYQLNDLAVRSIFGFFQKKREQLAQHLPSAAEFEQLAYRKSTGVNMALWYQHANARNSEVKWGNCTEQANISFVYLYTRVREITSTGEPSPINSLQRVDVDNYLGGHCYVLIDGMDEPAFLTQKTFKAHELQKLISSLQNTEVIVDPWNTKHPFYPAADISTHMPQCGLVGDMNIEFGLGFTEQEPMQRRRHTI